MKVQAYDFFGRGKAEVVVYDMRCIHQESYYLGSHCLSRFGSTLVRCFRPRNDSVFQTKSLVGIVTRSAGYWGTGHLISTNRGGQ